MQGTAKYRNADPETTRPTHIVHGSWVVEKIAYFFAATAKFNLFGPGCNKGVAPNNLPVIREKRTA
jgi:hypothetical protein